MPSFLSSFEKCKFRTGELTVQYSVLGEPPFDRNLSVLGLGTIYNGDKNIYINLFRMLKDFKNILIICFLNKEEEKD